MNDPMQFLWALIQFKAALLVLVLVLVLGFLLKSLPWFNNQLIPWVVVPASAILYLILYVPPPATLADVASTLVIGAFVGLCAWFYHAQLWKRLVDKLQSAGLDSPNNSNSNQNKTQP